MTVEHKPLAERVRDALALLPSREDAYEYRVRLAGLWPTHRALIADLWSTHPQNPAAQGEAREVLRCHACHMAYVQPSAAEYETARAADIKARRAALAVGETKGGA